MSTWDYLPQAIASASFPYIAKLPAESHVADLQGFRSGTQFATRETNRQANDIRTYRAECAHVPVRTNYLHSRAIHEPSDHTSVEGDHLFAKGGLGGLLSISFWDKQNIAGERTGRGYSFPMSRNVNPFLAYCSRLPPTS
jgi:hypothetical protein